MTDFGTLQIITKHGQTINLPLDGTFTLAKFVGAMRSAGHIINEGFYLPMESVAFMTIIPPAVGDPMQAQMESVGATKQ